MVRPRSCSAVLVTDIEVAPFEALMMMFPIRDWLLRLSREPAVGLLLGAILNKENLPYKLMQRTTIWP